METNPSVGLSAGVSASSSEALSGEQQSTQDQAAVQGSQEGSEEGSSLPEHIPYGRFQEVVGQKNQLEQQLAQAAQYIAMVQAQQAQPQPVTPQVVEDYDPQVELAKLEQDPKGYMKQLAEEIKREAVQELARTQYADKVVNQALESAISEYPVLNDPQARFYIQERAQQLHNMLPTHDQYGRPIKVEQIFKMAAKEIHDFAFKLKTTGSQEAVQRTQSKVDAYVEGSGNMVPRNPGPGAAYDVAKASGDVQAMLAARLQKLKR